MFLLCFILAQADKQIMGLLAVPVQGAFNLTNAQLGLLQGGAWAIAYAIGGLPIARLLDAGHRVRIAAACVALWSLATILSGFAWSFLALIVFRALTAVAEAGLPPAAFSVFSQSGNRRVVARLTNTFMLAPFIGGGLMLLLGGLLIKAIAASDWPILAGVEPWRAVFFAVGVPGLLVAPLLVFIGREPARRVVTQALPTLPTMRAVVRAIFVESRFLRAYYLGLTAFYVVSAALIAWYPSLLVRKFGLSVGTAGGYAGITFLVAGVSGTLAVNVLTQSRKQLSVATMVRDYCVVASVMVPVAIMLPLVTNIGFSLVLYALYAFLSAAVMASMAVPMQLCLPTDMLARGVAVSSLMMSALAGSAGPLVVGLLVDAADISLSGALALTGGVAAVLACVLLVVAGRHAPSMTQ
jgi:MFS family permease